MRLYKIKTRMPHQNSFLEDRILSLGYVVAESDDGIYEDINQRFQYGNWPFSAEMTREEIITKKGDYDCGDRVAQNFGWEDLGEISAEDIACLKRLKILAE